MTLNPGNNPFALFTGLDGRPLNGGKVYIGVAGQDPETNPQPIFWDAEGNVAAPNPMETQAGYVWNNGGPARFWTQDTAYSIRVRDRLERQVFYSASVAFEIPSGTVLPPGSVTAGSLPATDADNAAISDKLVYQHSANAPAYLTLANKLREGVSIRNFGGAVGNATANTKALNDFALAAAEAGPEAVGLLEIPQGEWEINGPVDLQPGGLAAGLAIVGKHREYSKLFTVEDISLFKTGANLILRDIGIEQRGTRGTGVGLETLPTYPKGEISYCRFERIHVYNFKFGQLARYSIWNSIRDSVFSRNTCGIRLARTDNMTDQTNPPAAGGWNGLTGTGWFHNQLTLQNVQFHEGEVGLWASTMGCHFDNITTQGQNSDGTANTVLPPGEVGTGIWLDGGSSSDLSWNNVLTNFYAESTHQPLKILNTRHVLIDGMFVQGGPQATPFKRALHLANATATLRAATGQDWFENMAVLENNATLYGSLPGFGTVATYSADGTSAYYPNEHRLEQFFRHYQISKASGTTGVGYTLPAQMDIFGMWMVSVNAVVDGTTQSNVTYVFERWNSPTLTTKQILTGTEAHYSLSVVGNQLRLTPSTSASLSAHIHIARLGDIAGQTITVAAN